MSTRAQVRFATREEGVTFSEHPNAIHAQFYVHSDGYPEGLGLEIAQSLTNYGKIVNWEIESLVAKHGDLEYIYYIWQAPGKSTWISIFEINGHLCEHCDKYIQKDKCIFVGEPSNLIKKYGSQLDESYYKI
tara:strand:+ start:66 stop:461 length:396 start_codon:yes stop_codon:yes gene_type:complete